MLICLRLLHLGECFITLQIGRKLARELPYNDWWDDASWEDIRFAGRKIIDDCLDRGPQEAIGGIKLIGSLAPYSTSMLSEPS